jgi:uncharacterized spore protein YtfJ
MDDKKITDIVSQLLDGVHGISKSETIIGEPQQAGDAVIIPVHRLKLAFGAGSAGANAQLKTGDGDSGLQVAGGAIELDPVAAIAVSRSGNPHLLSVDADATTTWEALLQQVPDIVTKVVQALGERVTQRLASDKSAPLATTPPTAALPTEASKKVPASE